MQFLKIFRRIDHPLIKRSQRCLSVYSFGFNSRYSIHSRKRFSSGAQSQVVEPASDLLKGKKALITGVGSGIGHETMRLFSKANCEIVGIELDESKIKKIQPLFPNIEIIKADVSKEDQVKEYVSTSIKKLGQIDILVNAAGDAPYIGPLLDATTMDWKNQLDVELMAKFWNCKYVIKHMIDNNIKGSVINLSTVGALRSHPNWGVYIPTKAAVSALSKSLSIECVNKGIRINSVNPGWIDTPIIDVSVKRMGFQGTTQEFKKLAGDVMPIQRMGRSDEVGHLILFLASDAASLCSGQDFICDAGMISSL